MMDPMLSLSFSVYSSKGTYALLLGSGVSRSAKVLTAWEIVEDMIRRVAKMEGADCEPDPFHWYQERFGEAPEYSKLLGSLAKTPAERQNFLKDYFEPTPEELAEGKKQPTAAHRAIAEMVQNGFVRVILTTNFDRLLETALNDVGITSPLKNTHSGLVVLPVSQIGAV
jgi:hypothetical protein